VNELRANWFWVADDSGAPVGMRALIDLFRVDIYAEAGQYAAAVIAPGMDTKFVGLSGNPFECMMQAELWCSNALKSLPDGNN
jgi:hypothetical protein